MDSTRLAHTSPDQATEEGSNSTFTMTSPEVADTVFSTPDDGCVTPETWRVTWQRINVCILLHRVGPLLTLNHDAWNHVFKKKNRVSSLQVAAANAWRKQLTNLPTSSADM